MTDDSAQPLPGNVWKEKVLKYQQPSLPRAIWQLVNTIGLYVILWYFVV